jgi:hypothetical protein
MDPHDGFADFDPEYPAGVTSMADAARATHFAGTAHSRPTDNKFWPAYDPVTEA